MRTRLVVAAAAAALGGCSLTLDPNGVTLVQGHFSGAVGSTWQALSYGASGCPGFSDYTPSGKTGFYALQGTTAYRFDPNNAASGAWTSVAAPPVDLSCWPGSTWLGDTLYAIQAGAVYAYGIGTGSWTTPVASGVGTTATSQVAHDDAGHIYAVETVAPYRVIRYDPVTNSITQLPTGQFNLIVSEPRIVWDPPTRRLYIAPAFYLPQLWSFDPASPGTAVRLADVPAPPATVGGPLQPGTGMGDPFCGDRSGHLFAIGGNGCSGANSVFQYDTQTGVWRAIPDLPEDHGCNGACTVSDDGWLYLTPGYPVPAHLFRIKLL